MTFPPLPAQKIDTETPSRERVVRVQTAMNHLTVIEVAEPVATVAVGSPQAFKVERRENKVFIQPLQENVATNLFIWTASTRLNYELVPAVSDAGQMDFAIDYRQPQPQAQVAQPKPAPVADLAATGSILIPAMVKRGWGRVVFVSSESAIAIPKEMIDYGMTKTAQIAVARGAIVLGTASPRHEAFVRGLGIAKFIDYTQGDVAGQAGRSDVVIDTVGGSEAIDAFHTLQPGGRFVSVARAGITAEQCAAAQVQCFGSPGPAAAAPVAALLQVAQLAGAGKITVHVDQTYPLASAAEALQYVHQGHTEGKVILAVTPQAQQR